MTNTPTRDAGKAAAKYRVVKRSNQLGVRSATLVGPNGFELSLEAGYTGLGNRTAVPIDPRKVETLEFAARACNAHEQLVAALEACAASLAHARDRLGMCGEGDGKDRKADAPDDIGSLPALLAARTALRAARGGEV